MSLILNIVANDVSGYFVTHTPGEVSVIPKLSCPKLFPELGKFLEYLSRRDALHYLDYFCRRIFWRCFGKYVHMVFHYFHRVYVKAVLFGNMLKHFFKVFRYLPVEYLFPVLGYPDQVVFKIVDGVFGSSYSHAVFYNSYYFAYQDFTRLTASRFHPASKLAGIQRRIL